MAPGPDQPNPARAGRILGPGQAVCPVVGRPVPGPGSTGSGEPPVYDGVLRGEAPGRRRRRDTDRANRRPDVHGIYWGYDGTPGLGTPPRMYNQITVHIADQMGSNAVELARLLALVIVAIAD